MKPDPLSAILPPITPPGLFGEGARKQAIRPIPLGPKIRSEAAGPGTWSTFWREFGTESEPTDRCYVPGDGRHLVDRHWAHFAAALPRAARVIDLGCGSGAVGRTLLACRADLHVAGVDWADVPFRRQANLTIHPGICMEALPFDDGSFDAAVSLFGIEYGDMGRTAPELSRVLKPGARFSFLVHHHESEIVREGRARRQALKELVSGKTKAAFLAGNIAAIDQQRRGLKARFPGQPTIDLLGDHFRRTIAGTRAQRLATWEMVASNLDPEISLLLHLEKSAKSAAGMGAWLTALYSDMRSVGVSVLRRSTGEPIAWEVSGIK